MARSQRLRFSDVRAVFHLIEGVRERGGNTLAWREHMVCGLSRLLGTTVGGASEIRIADMQYGLRRVRGVVSVGYSTQREQTEHLSLVLEPDYLFADPALTSIASIVGHSRTMTRHQLVDDSTWYHSDHANIGCLPFGVDSYLHSQFPLQHVGGIHYITVSRPPSEAHLGERERRTLQLFHEELGRLWDRPPHDPRIGLRPRVAEMLPLLARGYSEKEVGAHTGLSVHTVHDYLKQIHRHFEVSNRAQLQAKLRSLAAADRRRPRLALEAETAPAPA